VPKEIIVRLNAVIDKAVNTPEVNGSMNKQGIEVETNTPEQFAALIHSEIARNLNLVRSAGIKPE
jgi:tripartite-type tricarboxylate transporter receptor subunit TctC